MPNRVIREAILRSERVDKLADRPEVENFYRRVLNIVDDFGRYPAHPSLLRAAAYPLRLDKVKDTDLSEYLALCVDAGLIQVYTVDGKSFLCVLDFGQHMRAKTSKYPGPPEAQMHRTCTADAMHLHRTCTADAPHLHSEAEAESESKAEAEAGDRARLSPVLDAAFHRLRSEYPNASGQDLAAQAWLRYVDTGEITGANVEEVFAGLRRWQESRLWGDEDGRYIPGLDKWLLKRAWKDFPKVSAAAKVEKRAEAKTGSGSDPYETFVEPEWMRGSGPQPMTPEQQAEHDARIAEIERRIAERRRAA